METVLIQFWNITIRIRIKRNNNIQHIRHVASRGGVHGEGGGYLVVVANIFLNFTYIKVNGHVVGPPLFGENINN